MTTPTLPTITEADAEPAQLLRFELTTRITTQPLHYRSGDEDTAAKSVHALFDKTRSLLAKHWQARAFAEVAEFLLKASFGSSYRPCATMRAARCRKLFRGELANRSVNPQTENTAAEPPFKDLKEWFQAMANNLLPDNDPAFEVPPRDR